MTSHSNIASHHLARQFVALPPRKLKRVAAGVGFILALQAVCAACNIPVFRYALERWRPDNGQIVVFTKSRLTEKQTAKIRAIEGHSSSNGGLANVKVLRHEVGKDQDEDLDALWQRMSSADNVRLPYVVVRSRVAKNKLVNSWRGPLNDFSAPSVLSSPARSEISKRLLTGGSAVWLVIRSSDKAQNKAVESVLESALKKLSAEVPLPEGIGLPGSELLSEVPLLMKFSVLTIDPEDAKERHLVDFVHALYPDAVKKKEPLVIPVFGRGRALEVIPASQINLQLVEDLTLFLCGACSCQVKEMNPGFDLLMSTDWKTELFGEDADEPTIDRADSEESDGLPVLIPIPSGRKK